MPVPLPVRIARVRAVAAAGVTAVVIVGCTGGGGGGTPDDGGAAFPEPREAEMACDGLLQPADPAAQPADFPSVPDMTFFRSQKQGKTNYYFGHVPGTNVVQLRDSVAAALGSAGFTVGAGDAEGNVEAETQFDGAHEGSIQVTRLCRDHLQIRVRYTN